MQRKHAMMAAGGAVAGAVLVFWFIQRSHEQERRTPAWNDPQQPVEGTAGEPTSTGLPLAPSPAASWNAMRPSSPRLGAGSVIMRSYAPNLVDDPESLVR